MMRDCFDEMTERRRSRCSCELPRQDPAECLEAKDGPQDPDDAKAVCECDCHLAYRGEDG